MNEILPICNTSRTENQDPLFVFLDAIGSLQVLVFILCVFILREGFINGSHVLEQRRN